MTKKILSKADILSAQDVHRNEVDVPEWGGSVYVATMTAGQRDALEALIEKMVKDQGVDEAKKLARAALFATSCCDADGAMLFTIEDLPALTKKSAAAVDRVISASQELNKLGDGKIAEIVKN